MKHAFYMLAFLFVVNVSFAQNVEVQGKLKVVDGTQGVNKVFVSDANGEGKWITNRQLMINQQKDMIGGPQRLIDWGFSVWELWYGGVPHSKIQGLKLPNSSADIQNARYVVMLDTAEIDPTYETLITGIEFHIGGVWACTNTAISGANSPTNGIQNTADIIAGCPVPPNPSHTFSTLTAYMNSSGDTGWWIASETEATMMYNQLISLGKWAPWDANGQLTYYWTSTESSGVNEATRAKRINRITGVINDELKSFLATALTLKKLNYQ